jgi:hypothetical protein
MQNSATTNPAHDQVPLRSLHRRQDAVSRRRQISHFDFFDRKHPLSTNESDGRVSSHDSGRALCKS